MSAENLRTGDFKGFLHEVVAIPSMAPHEQAMADFMEGTLDSIGFTVERQVIDESGRANLLAQRGDSPSWPS